MPESRIMAVRLEARTRSSIPLLSNFGPGKTQRAVHTTRNMGWRRQHHRTRQRRCAANQSLSPRMTAAAIRAFARTRRRPRRSRRQRRRPRAGPTFLVLTRALISRLPAPSLSPLLHPRGPQRTTDTRPPFTIISISDRRRHRGAIDPRGEHRVRRRRPVVRREVAGAAD